jgi:arylsulfatase A-like enzyme
VELMAWLTESAGVDYDEAILSEQPSRREWLQAAAGAWIDPPRPNVLLVLADQYPAYATGYNGDPFARTPNLDRMAREGARFSNAVSNCPVCTPYRAMLQTGRWPLATGIIANDLRLPEQERTIGEAFHDTGYQTAYIGKWHLDGPDRWGFTPPGARRGAGRSRHGAGPSGHGADPSLPGADPPFPGASHRAPGRKVHSPERRVHSAG